MCGREDRIAELQPEVSQALADYRLPETLGFGVEMAPVMYRSEYYDGEWKSGDLLPFADVSVNPASTALQFGQQCFEGMKAYQVESDHPMLFRPNLNFRRFQKSARRLCMPEVPSALFAEALSSIANAMQPHMPGGPGQSLYLRPTLFGLDPQFAVKSSERFAFLVLASPSDAYYADPIRVMVERDDCRAAVGGTGAEKVGGNYGASLLATERCIQKGFHQSLWLDPKRRCNIEELSAMNFMAVVDGALRTPELSGSILDGVTRDSLLEIARHSGIDAKDTDIPIDEILQAIESGRCSEAFACGTGAIVCPISAIGESNGKEYPLPEVNQMASTLRRALLDIQECRAPDPFDWVIDSQNSQVLAEYLEK
ncbi:MAG TPA: branched-chain amino acid aminotransferase [Opitutae bacterium]|nr:branched chain amino acid aminotransferase [Opitutaceae bacterium]HCR29650.1 branched-chain amino acid aminotransferase [Opitutae bacterium]